MPFLTNTDLGGVELVPVVSRAGTITTYTSAVENNCDYELGDNNNYAYCNNNFTFLGVLVNSDILHYIQYMNYYYHAYYINGMPTLSLCNTNL